MLDMSLSDLLAASSDARRSYAEVLRVKALSAGVYELAAGAEDLQQPHTEDEVYVVFEARRGPPWGERPST